MSPANGFTTLGKLLPGQQEMELESLTKCDELAEEKYNPVNVQPILSIKQEVDDYTALVKVEKEEYVADEYHEYDACNTYETNGHDIQLSDLLHSDIFECETCSKVFYTRSSISQHVRRHLTQSRTRIPKFTCISCGIVSRTRKAHSNHMKLHINPPLPFSCKYCGVVLDNSNHLRTHVRAHETKQVPNFYCDQCGMYYQTRSGLVNHKKVHSEVLDQRKQTDGCKRFACELCDGMFMNKKSLGEHMLVHTGELPFHCTQCSKSFRLERVLKRHIQRHTGQKPFSCSLCGKTFSRRYLMTHHQSKCTGEVAFAGRRKRACKSRRRKKVRRKKEEFMCDICSFKCFGKREIARHMPIHCGNCAYRCDVCDAPFLLDSLLMEHINSIHDSETNSI